MQFSSKDIQLFNEAGINVEDKNYTKDEVERLKIKVTDFINCAASLKSIVYVPPTGTKATSYFTLLFSSVMSVSPAI